MANDILFGPEQKKLHVGIIMDGNGRWAQRKGLPRFMGHREGAEAARKIIETAPTLDVGTLTIYAFSSDNWNRPPREVATLMNLFRTYLYKEVNNCIRNGIRMSIIGRRDRFDESLLEAIDHAETETQKGSVLHLRVAVDYSARDAILRAALQLNTSQEISREVFSRLLGEEKYTGVHVPDVDILIRSGGEKRLSDFLLWECAYAELFFSNKMWPEFTSGDFSEIVNQFSKRERRFGRVHETAVV
jgi:undecaprenyl diphosphate synthase